MKEETVNKLVSLEKRIGSIIRMFDKGKSVQNIIPEIDKARSEIRGIEGMILEDHLATTLKQTKMRKSKRENILKLCGF